MSAIVHFSNGSSVAQELWAASQQSHALYKQHQGIADAAADPQAKDIAQKLADGHLKLHRALVESAAVRLATAWEMFLHELFVEYLKRRPSCFAKVWLLGKGTRAKITDETIVAIIESQQRPFQDLEKAKRVFKMYLGEDIFESKKVTHIDLTPAVQLLQIRHAIVHKAGNPTKLFRRHVSKSAADAHSYLVSMPSQGQIPATEFERILAELSNVCSSLCQRAFKKKRP